MSNDYFRFKQFTVRQDKCAMKVGTDGVLLGSWVDAGSCRTILDVGTGTGLIALMLAQRSQGMIDAIDIEKDAVVQAAENIASSVFADRIRVFHASLSDFAARTDRKYDLIVSNPPYFVRSLKSPDDKKNLARHTDTLPLTELISKSKSLLTEQGRLALILPCQQEDELARITEENCLSITRKTYVSPMLQAPPKRLLVELSANTTPDDCRPDSFAIEISRHQYTAEYIRLTRDYYLNM